MNDNIEEIIKELKEFGKDILSDKEKMKQFLQATGIYTKTGRLSKNYKQPKELK